jgi:anaerobic selenocysteine-containing dehydrogenase
VFVAADDAARIGVDDGDPVVVRSDHGQLHGRVRISALRAGNVQVFFPEGNVLLPMGRRDESGVPDYTAPVEVVPAR